MATMSDELFPAPVPFSNSLLEHDAEARSFYDNCVDVSGDLSLSWPINVDEKDFLLNPSFDGLGSVPDLPHTPLELMGYGLGADAAPFRALDDIPSWPVVVDNLETQPSDDIANLETTPPLESAELREHKRATGHRRNARRTRIPAKVKLLLDKRFENDPYPGPDDLEALSHEHNLLVKSIKNWFANSRARRVPPDHQIHNMSQQASCLANPTERPTDSSPVNSCSPLDRYLASSPEGDPVSSEDIAANIVAAAMEHDQQMNDHASMASMPHSDRDPILPAFDSNTDPAPKLMSRNFCLEVEAGSSIALDENISRPYLHKCSLCSRSFSKVEHLTRHEQSHAIEKPYKCPDCTRCYANVDLLLRHQRNLHSSYSRYTPPRDQSIGLETRTFDSGSNAGSNASLGSANSANSACSRSSRKGRRRWKTNKSHTRATPSSAYHCTFPGCGKAFESRYEWTRHEETVHFPRTSWICCKRMGPPPSWGDLAMAPSSLLQILEQLFSNCYARPEDERTFFRKDHFVQHIKRCHLNPKRVADASMRSLIVLNEDEVLVDLVAYWRQERPSMESIPDYARQCSLCSMTFEGWSERMVHIGEHFETGAFIWWLSAPAKRLGSIFVPKMVPQDPHIPWHCQFCPQVYLNYATALKQHHISRAWSCQFVPTFNAIWRPMLLPMDKLCERCILCGFEQDFINVNDTHFFQQKLMHEHSHLLYSCESQQIMSFDGFCDHLRTHAGVPKSMVWQEDDLLSWSAVIKSSRPSILKEP